MYNAMNSASLHFQRNFPDVQSSVDLLFCQHKCTNVILSEQMDICHFVTTKWQMDKWFVNLSICWDKWTNGQMICHFVNLLGQIDKWTYVLSICPFVRTNEAFFWPRGHKKRFCVDHGLINFSPGQLGSWWRLPRRPKSLRISTAGGDFLMILGPKWRKS